jgi:hypothetical protein
MTKAGWLKLSEGRNFMKVKLFLLLLLVCVVGLHAEEAEEKGDGVKTETDIAVTISSLPEAKVEFSHTWIIPFMQGENFLTQDNNLSVALGADITPISINGLAKLVWTPAAFFQVFTGGRIGSGWNIVLFGKDIKGIGINNRKPDGSTEVVAAPGLLWMTRLGGTLQFDFAALSPGDWHHVVFSTSHEINYSGYSAASGADPWYYENDDGENQNGFNYYGNFLLGYQMPIFLDTVALLAEQDIYLYKTPDPQLWGGALPRWVFSGLFNFTITERLSIAAICQFRTRRTWTSGTKDKAFYQDRRLEKPSQHLEFYRVAGILNIKLF